MEYKNAERTERTQAVNSRIRGLTVNENRDWSMPIFLACIQGL